MSKRQDALESGISILIQGVRMPQKGKRLFVAVNGCGDVYLVTSAEKIITKYQPSAKAVELPPHGRLIDADALCEGLVSNHPVVIYAKNADTIIPADGTDMRPREVSE